MAWTGERRRHAEVARRKSGTKDINKFAQLKKYAKKKGIDIWKYGDKYYTNSISSGNSYIFGDMGDLEYYLKKVR